jgi:transcriptional regulator with XRE-family HTH domain
MKPTNKERDLRRQLIGFKLRERRIEVGLTQWDLARELRYSTAQFVSNWERGLSLPPVTALPPLAHLLKIQPKQMIDIFHAYERAIMELNHRRLVEAFELAGL